MLFLLAVQFENARYSYWIIGHLNVYVQLLQKIFDLTRREVDDEHVEICVK